MTKDEFIATLLLIGFKATESLPAGDVSTDFLTKNGMLVDIFEGFPFVRCSKGKVKKFTLYEDAIPYIIKKV